MELTVDNVVNQILQSLINKIDKQNLDPRFVETFLASVIKKLPISQAISQATPKDIKINQDQTEQIVKTYRSLFRNSGFISDTKDFLSKVLNKNTFNFLKNLDENRKEPITLQNVVAKGLEKLENLKIKGIEKLKDLSIQGVDKLKDISIKGIDKLKDFKIEGINKLKDISIKGLEKLKDLSIKGIDRLKDIKIEGISKLKDISINGLEKLKDISIKGIDKLKDFKIENLTRVTKNAAAVDIPQTQKYDMAEGRADIIKEEPIKVQPVSIENISEKVWKQISEKLPKILKGVIPKIDLKEENRTSFFALPGLGRLGGLLKFLLGLSGILTAIYAITTSDPWKGLAKIITKGLFWLSGWSKKIQEIYEKGLDKLFSFFDNFKTKFKSLFNFEGFKSFFDNLISRFKSFLNFDGLKNSFKSFFDNLKARFKSLFNFEGFKSFFDNLKTRFKSLFNFDDLKNSFKNFFDDLKTRLKSLFNFEGLKNSFKGFFEDLKTRLKSLFNFEGVKSFFNNLKTKFKSLFNFDDLKNSFKSFFSNIFDNVKSFFGNAFESITNMFKAGADDVVKGAEKATDFGSYFKSLLKSPKLWLRKIPILGTLLSIGVAADRFRKGDIFGGSLDILSGIAAIVPVYGTAIALGIDAINALLDYQAGGIGPGKPSKGGIFKGWLTTAWEYWKEKLKKIPIIHYISKVGEYISEGKWAEALAAFPRIIPGMGWLLDLMGQTEEVQVQSMKDAGNKAQELWNWVKENIFEKIKGLVGSIVDGFKGVWSGVTDTAGDLWGGLKSLVGLADGGIVTKPTRALVGEAGPEAVIPLEKYFNKSDFTLNNNALESIASNTKDTNASLKALSEVMMRMVMLIDKKLSTQSTSPAVIGLGGQQKEPISASALANSNFDPIRAIRAQFA